MILTVTGELLNKYVSLIHKYDYIDKLIGANNMNVTYIRTNYEESVLFKSYAKLHGISLSEAFKQALIEKIEDEFDIADMEVAVKKFEKDPKTYSLEELRKKYVL